MQPPRLSNFEYEILFPGFHEDFLKQIDPTVTLSPEARILLSQVAEDFLKQLTTKSIQLAHNRKSTILEISDVRHCLHSVFHLDLPGFETRAFPAGPSSEYLDQLEAVHSFLAKKTSD
jgi:transcription initiation factor TFIID subunit TAF12